MTKQADCYRFGPWALDTARRELRRGDQLRVVEPQVFDLLVYLLEHRDRVVAHADLVDAVWGGRPVSDSAIAARISAARRAVGDSGATQSVIKTVPRKGFRFIAEVQVDTPDIPAEGPDDDRQTVRFCQSEDGVRIAFANTGSGRPLVRAGHWLTHLEHDWRSPIWRPFLDRLGARFEVVRYDQRGNGLSDWAVDDFSLCRFVEDLASVVDAAGLDRFVLYGTSQGAAVAVAYAAAHPERVERLVLHGGYVQGRLVRRSTAEREQGEAILTLMRHGWGAPGSAFLTAFASMYIPNGSREQTDSLVDLQRVTTHAENAIAIRRAVDQFDVASLLPRVATPTLVIHARGDGVHPLDQGRALAAGIAGSEFVLLESANHMVLPQEPAWAHFFSELYRFAAA